MSQTSNQNNPNPSAFRVECGVEPSFLPGIFFTTLSVLSGSKSDVDEKIREHRVLLCNAYQGWEDRNSGAP
eukprot:125859-Amorphochlora_amoeboformis.AAC.1